MTEYHEILEHRIRQFVYYLELMRTRQRNITCGASFVIFNEDDPGGFSTDGNEFERAAVLRLPATASCLVTGDAAFGLYTDPPDDFFDDLWREDDSSKRFVQFSFNRRYFDMDLPNTTLYPPEARELLSSRLGFFYARDRPSFQYPGDHEEEYDPFRKGYVYGDERTAAEDMAFIWFQVWKFPVDWRFYVTAAAFHEDTEWEDAWPLDAQTPVGDGIQERKYDN